MTSTVQSPVVQVHTYRDVLEVFCSPAMSAAVDSERDAEIFRGETIFRIDGARHRRRRKALSQLIRRDGHKWFRDEHLYPTISRTLQQLRSDADRDGLVHRDLIEMVTRINLRLGIAITGIDGVDSEERLDELQQIIDDLHVSGNLFMMEKYLVATGQPALDEQLAELPRAAKQRFVDRFFDGSLARRRKQIADVESTADGELPARRDAMSIIAAEGDPDYADSAVAVREILTLIRGSVATSANALSQAVIELEDWFEHHPEDRELRTDPEFLMRALNETLRVHVLRDSVRLAVEDVTLASGVQIRAGQYVSLHIAEASRDKDVYGEDADEFNPRRTVPDGILAYGFAFGGGPHMCLGQPLVLGNQGIDGSLVHTLKSLYEAGIELDEAHQVTKHDGDFYAALSTDRIKSCPVVFRSGS